MRRVSVLALGMAFLLSSLTWNCGDDNGPGPAPSDSIVGSWEHGVAADGLTWTLCVLDSGVFEATDEHDHVTAGTYSTSGNEITFVDGACGEGVEGSYTFSISGDELTLTLVSDECEDRLEVIVGTWTRIS